MHRGSRWLASAGCAGRYWTGLDWTGLDEDASVDEFLNGCISGRLTHTEFRSDKGNGHDGLA